ncbi:MAG: DUF938 domain-containing protein, partial [Xanthomonadales bacterium]|nr:DUF938 domain-containing protein [Xanthomonadales bacterium]
MNRGTVLAASQRNKGPILEQLRTRLAGSEAVLEIGSGLGQHALHFCEHLPGLTWQPTERRQALDALVREIAPASSAGLRAPRQLDVLHDPWPAGPWDVVYTANTAHIMPWPAVLQMLKGAAKALVPGGRFFIYGPFNVSGEYTSEGNRRFDRELRQRDP